MLKDNKKNIFFIVGISIIIYIGGCVDTSVNPIPSNFNFRSQVNIVNLAEGIDTAKFSMTTAAGEKISFNNIAFGDESPSGSFMDVPAGSKTLEFKSESLKLNTEVDKKIRLFVVGADSSTRTVSKFTQRYIFQTIDDPGSSSLYREDTTAIAFVNGSPDANVDGLKAVSSDTDTMLTFSSSLGVGGFNGYFYIKSGTYTFYVFSGEDTLSTIQADSLGGQKRYTIAVYDVKESLKSKLYTDD